MSPDHHVALHDLNACGCCEGISTSTPVVINNRSGLSAIAYRVGTHADFKESMLAALSSSEYPNLRSLTTRSDDDFCIALLDAWATAADVLTFYQERIANESYLRTATDRRSILELARLTGYELSPGVAASTYLAFTLEDAPEAPQQAIIDIGTKVQSIPGPGEKPQTFETVEKIEARAEWNALKPKLTELRWPAFEDDHIYLKGITTNLKPGDALLIVGGERENDPGSERWEFRRVVEVKPEHGVNRTLIMWTIPLGHRKPRVEPPETGPKVYALRQRAAIFGHNALQDLNEPDNLFNGGERNIRLDAVYSQIVANSWIVLSCPQYEAELFRVKSVTEETKAAYNMAAKTTRLEISGENIGYFSPRSTTIFAQSEELEMAEAPIEEHVFGSSLPLDRRVEGLKKGQHLLISGNPVFLTFDSPESSEAQPVGISAGRFPVFNSAIITRMQKGFVTSSNARESEPVESRQISAARPFAIMLPEILTSGLSHMVPFLRLVVSDERVSEMVTLLDVEQNDNSTRLIFAKAPHNLYKRESVVIYANVALATHGETVNEVLGSGDGSRTYQRIILKQPPLTQVSASTPSGQESTLEVRVNDIKWREVPALYGHRPNERIYITRVDGEGRTTVQFGDGLTGARLPSGQDNVKATYRKGIGFEGNAKPGQLSLLMTRPLGVKGVTNPGAANGGADRESRDDARRNAPLKILTLDRIVSLKDYEDFARAFSGVAKALATWTWDGEKRGVFVTVAGSNGAEILPEHDCFKHLLAAMQKAGDPHVSLNVMSYRRAVFKVAGTITVDPDYQSEKARAAIELVLRTLFSFDVREFGQPVMLSEVIAVIQAVPGVVAVDIDKLYRIDQRTLMNYRLSAALPEMFADGGTAAAELLTLDPSPLADLAVIKAGDANIGSLSGRPLRPIRPIK